MARVSIFFLHVKLLNVLAIKMSINVYARNAVCLKQETSFSEKKNDTLEIQYKIDRIYCSFIPNRVVFETLNFELTRTGFRYFRVNYVSKHQNTTVFSIEENPNEKNRIKYFRRRIRYN